MESKAIKENRRAKFLAKLANNKNKENKKIYSSVNNSNQINQLNQNNINTSINQPIQNNFFNKGPLETFIKNSIPELNNFKIPNQQNNSQSLFQSRTQQGQQGLPPSLNQNLMSTGTFNQNQENDKIKNEQTQKKIDFNELFIKMNRIEFMINFQNLLKKLFIIVLSVLHCINYYPLDNDKTLKYTIVVLEITSIFLNYYYNQQKKIGSSNFDNNSSLNQKNSQIDNIFGFIVKNFGVFNRIFNIFIIIKDIFADICILFTINIIFFLIHEEDE